MPVAQQPGRLLDVEGQLSPVAANGFSTLAPPEGRALHNDDDVVGYKGVVRATRALGSFDGGRQ
jgi:hypothetical protein